MVTASLTRALEFCAPSAVADASAGQPSGDVRVGVDVLLVSEVLDSMDAFGAGYLQRIYTAGELADCGSVGAVSASRLAARFAVKEAVTKIIAPRDAPGWWRDIETVRAASGACTIRLYGEAAAAADRAGLAGWGVSLTHEGEYAAAVVVARSIGRSPPGGSGVTTGMHSTVSTEKLTASVVSVLAAHARLAVPAERLAPGADLYAAGMSSHASVNVMLALEDAFDLEFPERMLRKATFGSIESISAAVKELLDSE